MSDDKIEYCPWCGNDVERTIEQYNHVTFQALQCVCCDTVFKVKVPHTETEVSWTTAK